MALSEEQKNIYKKSMEEAKKQLESIDVQMEEELQRVREKLAKIQESKKWYRQVYLGAANLLGIKVELEEEKEEKRVEI